MIDSVWGRDVDGQFRFARIVRHGLRVCRWVSCNKWGEPLPGTEPVREKLVEFRRRWEHLYDGAATRRIAKAAKPAENFDAAYKFTRERLGK